MRLYGNFMICDGKESSRRDYNVYAKENDNKEVTTNFSNDKCK